MLTPTSHKTAVAVAVASLCLLVAVVQIGGGARKRVALEQHHYLDEDSGAAARRHVWAYGNSYVKQPTSNPHHYLDFPRFAKHAHHYLDTKAVKTSKLNIYTDMANGGGPGSSKGQPKQIQFPFPHATGGGANFEYGAKAVKTQQLNAFTDTTFAPPPKPAHKVWDHTASIFDKSKQPKPLFKRFSNEYKGKTTKLSGLEGQPAAPFGGQTFGKPASGYKAKLTKLSGLEGQPAAPFGGQTFGKPASGDFQ